MESYVDLLVWLAEHPIESVVVLFVEFVVLMKLYHNVEHKVVRRIGLFIFIPQDVVVNMVFGTLIGLELPREWLLTQRWKRWKKLSDSKRLNRWRRWVAVTGCDLLNPHDPGHC